jgi:uncharacterized iron-regulated membrane protein
MLQTFRQSMAWLHTSLGLVVGWVMFAIFFAGTVAVFRQEIDYWMRPELHVVVPPQTAAAIGQQALEKLAPRAVRWTIELPSHRVPALRVTWQNTTAERAQGQYLDSAGRTLTPRDTRGGTMIYRFHYGLLLGTTGMWVVGAMGMAMVIALISGVIVHAKIFREFFTFRPKQAAPRSFLDAHNVSGVMVLPFSLMIAYSGLVIWWFIWMPAGWQVGYDGDRLAFFKEMTPAGFSAVPPSSAAATLTPLGALIARAEGDAPSGHPLIVSSVSVSNPNTTGARIDVTRVSDNAMWGQSDQLRFDGVTGAALDRKAEVGSSGYVMHRVFRIIHEIKFADATLRWLYFLMSAVSCAMIGTGMMLWAVKRRARHVKALAQIGQLRHAVSGFAVEALNAAVIAGMFTATGAYFWANRIIPVSWAGRADLEVQVFFGAWIACAVWALLHIVLKRNALGDEEGARRVMRDMWSGQWLVATLLFAGLPLVDQITTGDVSHALARGDTIVLGFHATVLAAAAIMIWAGLKSRQQGRVTLRRKAA